MARRVILETSYTFTPSTRTVVIPRALQKERLLLITNVTSNTVIYNFSDPTLTATSWTIAQNTNNTTATTTVVLNYNTTSMNTTDKLQITIDEISENFVPEEGFIDPVGKMRVSTPQSMIDTDFEYSLQPNKWEAIILTNGKPSFYTNTQNPITITDVQATNGSTTVTVLTTTPPAIGTPVLIQDTYFPPANGSFAVISVSAGVNFTYNARTAFTGTTGSIYNSALTLAFSGNFYSNANIALASQPTAANPITLTTTYPHGFQVGDGIYILGSSASTNPPNGAWQIAAVPTSTTLQVVLSSTPTGSITGATLYPKPDGYFIHRAFDGGVQFTAGNNAHNIQAIRQTRRNFRYQAGKGLQISTGTIMKPSINLDNISASGTTVTVTCKEPHQITAGVTIVIAGCNETAYNGTFTVQSVIDTFNFTYVAGSTPSASPASGMSTLSVTSWYGATVSLGLYDNQNGLFFQFDGQTINAVRRNSIFQIQGFVNVATGNTNVTGATINGVVNTKFSKQLAPGDWVVIRGMSYRVISILSDTSMHVSPPYRGPTLSGLNAAIVSKTVDTKIPQSLWNIDKMDGTGPSGLVLDLSKMQMFYIDYSWYGAGTIRFGFRDTQGRVFYCHRFVNNNQNLMSYMRSGNLPARYEANTFTPYTTLGASMLSSDTTMTVASTSGFPSSGTLFIDDPGANGGEYVNYTGTTTTTFTGLTRGKASTTVAAVTTVSGNAFVTTTNAVSAVQNGMLAYGTGIPSNTYVYNIITGATNTIQLTQGATASGSITLSFNQMASAAAAHTYSATAPITVYLHAPQFSPTINHWGTSVVMDGRYDNDKALVFTYGETSSTTVVNGASVPLFSLRVAPAVDSGVTSYLGLKEVINRMQLNLNSMAVLTNGSFLVTIVLNGAVAAGSGTLNSFGPIAVGSSSLAQIADHTGNVTISGGETIFGFYAVNSAGGSFYSVQEEDLSQVRDIGNSVWGGGLNNTPGVGIYPDGPDVITIVAKNIGGSTANVQARLNWTEAQA